jgi:hypothetical protein
VEIAKRSAAESRAREPRIVGIDIIDSNHNR